MKSLLLLTLLLVAYTIDAQSDGTAYNKYMVAHENRTYVQIGRYRVTGSPYLHALKHTGNMYAKGETGLNILLSYNTYTQELEFNSAANPERPLIKEPGSVDSFLLRKDSVIRADMFFVYGAFLGAKDKQYYQRLVDGNKFVLYKKYKADLEVVSTNYVDGNLRQFEIATEYYWFDAGTKTLKKLKANPYTLRKEFGFLKTIGNYTGEERLNTEPENVLLELFAELNSTK